MAESTTTLKAFADPVRLRLLHLLEEGREICVCHLHEALALPQPTVSRHLAYLRRHGFVATRKDGFWVHYRRLTPADTLRRVLLERLGDGLGDPEVFRLDRVRLLRALPPCCPP